MSHNSCPPLLLLHSLTSPPSPPVLCPSPIKLYLSSGSAPAPARSEEQQSLPSRSRHQSPDVRAQLKSSERTERTVKSAVCQRNRLQKCAKRRKLLINKCTFLEGCSRPNRIGRFSLEGYSSPSVLDLGCNRTLGKSSYA